MVKRKLIMEKSLELFAENGFEATSVQQITERCGISKGAFYLHFKSKDELINSLIDQFMTGILNGLERSVNDEQPSEELLYNYIYTSLGELQQQSNFAKFFLTEQVLTYNKDFFERMQKYMNMFNMIILSIVERQFRDTKPNMYLDLVFTVNGLIKSYAELLLIDNYKVDLGLLCRSIVEKVTIIAERATVQFVTPEYLSHINQIPIYSKEQLTELITTIQQDIQDDEIIGESLQLLKDHLHEPKLSGVLIEGLLKNIKENENCTWCAYLYSKYLQNGE